LVVAAHALWVVLSRDRPPPRWFAVVGGVYLVLLIPLLVFFVTREGDPISWLDPPSTMAAVKLTAGGLAGGSWGVVLYGLAGVAGVWAAVTAVRSSRDQRARAWLLPAIWLVVPVAAATLSTATVKPLLEARFLMGVVPALVLLAAMGVCRMPRGIGIGLLGALLLVSAIQVDRWYDAPGEGWRDATELVSDLAAPGTEVILVPWGGVFALRYYESRQGVSAADVVRVQDDGFPTGPRLIEVLRRTETSGEIRVPDAYRAQRDREYELEEEHALEGLVIRAYARRSAP
jgi:hypothetical protein